MSDVEVIDVRPAHQFDQNALREFMSAHVAGFCGDLTVRQFEGGQSNPTFLLEAAGRRYVMRKQPPGKLLPSAHQVDREHRVMHALRNTPVPVPNMFCLCEDAAVIGTKFFVMEWIDGRLFNDTCLPECSPEDRRAIYNDLARVLAELHKVDPTAVGLETFGRPGNYYERQIGRWSKQYIASKTEQIDEMDALMEWLPANVPQDVASVVVHGDYRLGNVLLHPTEPHIVGVLDWELSTRGDGLADLGYICQDYHGESYEDIGLAGADLAALNIPNEDEFVAEYCKHAGRENIDNWTFYIAYNMFRSAGIVQGVYRRGLDGNASSAKAMQYKEMARRRAERAWQLLRERGLV
ncbi:MAG: phosphotransferase [Planctomycetaceae bacterium]